MMTHSRDHGATWEAATDITASSKPVDWGFVAFTVSGTQLRTGPHTTEAVEEVANPLGLFVSGPRGTGKNIGDDGTVQIFPSARFCTTEPEVIACLCKIVILSRFACCPSR